MSKFSRGVVAVGTLAALAFGLTPAKAVETLSLSLCKANQSFRTPVTNPYAPFKPGQESTLFGIDEGEPVGLRITVTNDTERFYTAGNDGVPTVTTMVVEELEWADTNGDGSEDGDELIELSRNFFAQTAAGTVCYFGEEVTIFDAPDPSAGSWRADDPNSSPGIFMPASPEKGLEYQMENSPIAKDTATILGVKTVKVPFDQYRRAIKVRDCNPFDQDCGIKYYAPGVGLIVDGALELTHFESGS